MLRDQLKLARREKNLSIEELAKDLSFSPLDIRSWEKGTSFPNSTQLFQLANYFKTTATDLLDEDEDIYLTADIDAELQRLDAYLKKERENKKKGAILLLSVSTTLFLLHLILFVAIWATFYNTPKESPDPEEPTHVESSLDLEVDSVTP